DAELAPYWRSLPAVMPLARDVFDGATAERRLTAYFAVQTTEAFGTFSRLELTAAAACVTYVERTQPWRKPPLSPPNRAARRAARHPGSGAHAFRRAPRLAARRHRPQRDGGGLAPARATALRAAHRCGCDRAPPRCGRDAG